MVVTKKLSGLILCDSSIDSNYVFVAPAPNTLPTEVLSEVYIHCDTSAGAISINLPSISTLGYYNAKIYVVDIGDNAGTNNITIVAYEGNTINSATNLILNTNSESVALSIVSNNQWLGVQSSNSNALPYKVYTALLTQSGGNIPYYANDEILTIGASYQITNTDGDTVDFTNIGAPNNNLNTWFVATGEIANSWGETNSGNLYNNIGAPVTTVLENTIGNIWWTYDNVGGYSANSNGLFTINKIFASPFQICINYDGANGYNIYISPNISDSVIYITTMRNDENIDGIFNIPIEIRVYN